MCHPEFILRHTSQSPEQSTVAVFKVEFTDVVCDQNKLAEVVFTCGCSISSPLWARFWFFSPPESVKILCLTVEEKSSSLTCSRAQSADIQHFRFSLVNDKCGVSQSCSGFIVRYTGVSYSQVTEEHSWGSTHRCAFQERLAKGCPRSRLTYGYNVNCTTET